MHESQERPGLGIHPYDHSTLGGRGRKIISSRLAWAINQLREILSQSEKKRLRL